MEAEYDHFEVKRIFSLKLFDDQRFLDGFVLSECHHLADFYVPGGLPFRVYKEYGIVELFNVFSNPVKA